MKCLFHKWKTVAESPKWETLQCGKCGKVKWIEKFYGGYQPRPRLPWEPEESKNPPRIGNSIQRRENMKQVQIAPKSVKEIIFESVVASDISKLSTNQHQDLPDTPFMTCPRCHADVLLLFPQISTAYAGNKPVERYAIFVCPECGKELKRINIPI